MDNAIPLHSGNSQIISGPNDVMSNSSMSQRLMQDLPSVSDRSRSYNNMSNNANGATGGD